MVKKAPIFSVANLTVSYSASPIVQDINFDIQPGHCFGLMGLNGAGKTTLIKAIMGLRQQDNGSAELLNVSSASSEGKRQISYLPEKFEPTWFLTGAEFLQFSFSVYGQLYERADIEYAAARLGLPSEVLSKKVQTYSKGMKQKLGLLGALSVPCKLVILDEPMSGLDPQARAQLKDMIEEAQKAGKTILMSSHILADMDEMCDRVALLHDRTLQFLGTPKKLKASTSCDHLERAFLQFIEKKEAA